MLEQRKKQVYSIHSFAATEDERRIRSILALYKNIKGDKFLDLGCGNGEVTRLLGNLIGAKEIYGIDISSRAIKDARERGVDALELDIDNSSIPFPDEFFDIINIGNLIHHLYDPDHLLDELFRLLKPRGISIISNRNLGAWHNRIALLLGYQPFNISHSLEHNGVGKLFLPKNGVGGHIGGFTLKALRQLLEIHHFHIECIKSTWNEAEPISYPYWVYILNKIINIVLNNFVSLAPITIIKITKK